MNHIRSKESQKRNYKKSLNPSLLICPVVGSQRCSLQYLPIIEPFSQKNRNQYIFCEDFRGLKIHFVTQYQKILILKKSKTKKEKGVKCGPDLLVLIYIYTYSLLPFREVSKASLFPLKSVLEARIISIIVAEWGNSDLMNDRM